MSSSMKKKDRVARFTSLMGEAMPYEQVAILRDNLLSLGFFDAPASTKYHGNYPGGLFDHSLLVTESLVMLTRKLGLKWEHKRSPYIVGMLHDLCKCDQYDRKPDGSFEYRKNLILTGHGDKSVIIAQKCIDLTGEEMLCIRWHMGAYEGESVWNNVGAAIESCNNVLFTHTADMMASRIFGI